MSEIFSNFENILILYAPTLLAYITQIVDWCVTIRTFKRLDVHKQLEPVIINLSNVSKEVSELKEKVNVFMKEKADLVSCIDSLKTM
jgi:hypothetical protein